MAHTDPRFRHHPQLAGRIIEPETSGLRDVTPALVRDHSVELGIDPSWVLDDATRDACRDRTMAGRWDRDLWVFAYGSLMWNPALTFAEVRRAFVPDAERRFILREVNGGRGTPERPGLMAALDAGHGCHGLAFRIEAAHLADETRRLWNRERLGDAYLPAFRMADTDHGPIEVLAFMADRSAPQIVPDLSHADQVRCGALGEGRLGTSREYLENLAAQFAALRIDDPALMRLVEDVRAYRADA